MPEALLSLEEYTALVEQAPIMIWRSGDDTLCDYFNERWLAFTGRTMAQEMGNGWAEGVHPEDFDRCLKIYVEAFHKRQVFEMDYRLRRHDGVYRWIFDRGVPFFDPDGRFKGYIGSCVDVTARIEELHRLRGMLPICAWCKAVRDDQGYWRDIDAYISEHTDARFSHGLCPACRQKHFAGYAEK